LKISPGLMAGVASIIARSGLHWRSIAVP